MKHTLEAAQRRALTTRAIMERRTLMERWETDEINRFPGWSERGKKAAYLIRPGEVVADIGCGTMSLEQYLPRGCTYIPVDVVARDDRTTILDLNASELPNFGADVIVALGLLEYLFEPKNFLASSFQTSPRIIFSYHPVEMDLSHDRLADYWVNSLSILNIMNLCFECGYSSVTVLSSLKNEMLFMAKRPEIQSK